MRPLKLTISGFGSYAEKTVIDFEKLGASGLYLITGDTGSGKTTIFDAITYALYGKASGDAREVKMLRSKYAKPETPTEVELVFSNAGAQYVIKRNEEYMRPDLRSKTRGVLVKQTAGVTLKLPGGKIVEKKDDVKAEIENIICVNENQFKQIAMIAQGDFAKFLRAGTPDRIKLFRHVFNTGIYDELQTRLKK